MSAKPDFATMTTPQLRAYVLEHRNDEKALQTYLDRRHAEQPDSQVYKADDNVADAIAEYINRRREEGAP